LQDGSETCLSVRLAIYRDGEPQPQVEEVQGTGPDELIHRLCTAVGGVITDLRGTLPQAAVVALIQNLLHAEFACATVSVLDSGRSLRVADRGPGIADKDRAREPGFSTATDAMRRVIPGVGAGLFVAAGLAQSAGGQLDVIDNLGGGTVATLSVPDPVRLLALAPGPLTGSQSFSSAGPSATLTQPRSPSSQLTDGGKRILLLLAELGGAAVGTICDELRIPPDEVESGLDALRSRGLLDPARSNQMILTPAGLRYLDGIFVE